MNTVPALVCGDPGFSDGGITSTWSYIHTGGLPLNRVYVSYTFEEGSTRTSSPIHVITFMNTQQTEANVPRLVAGRRYTFIITAENDVGSSYIQCGPILLSVGKCISIHAQHFVCITSKLLPKQHKSNQYTRPLPCCKALF